jgi:MFS transporter, DHA1 family, multidrug resistance protein
MHPDPGTLWRGPRWALALLLACLGMLGPFAIDAYLPAFGSMARQLPASPVQLQQTLAAYLAGFALMNLFHGAFADSFGRRPVVLVGVGVFTVSSVLCALAPSIETLIAARALQGMATGAGMVVSRAIIRDLYAPHEAQKVMSQVTIFFGVAPAVAPLIGGLVYDALGWRSVFWMLAVIGATLWLAVWRLLPESLHADQAQPFEARNLMRGYGQLMRDRRFFALALSSGIPFNGMFVYILSAPAWLGGVLQLAPTQFFWFFCCSIGGIMGGAWWSGRLAGRLEPRLQVRRGFTLMAWATAINLLLNALFTPQWWWAMPPVGLFAFGWSLMVPVVTIQVLDLAPERRGMASSLQATVSSVSNALVAGLVTPLVMHSGLRLALASASFLLMGWVAWWWVKRRLR